MRYMIIETYTGGLEPIYRRAAERGRTIPDGLIYLDSWIDADRLDRCFQLMETDDPSLFECWFAAWSALIRFEMVPVITSEEAARASGHG